MLVAGDREMAKPYTATDAKNVIARIKFSTSDSPLSHNGEYYAFSVSIQGTAVGDGAEKKVMVETRYYGTAKSSPYTSAEVMQALTAAGTLKANLITDLTAWYLEALNITFS